MAIVISGGVGATDIVGAGDDSSEIIAVDKSRELTIDQDSGRCIHRRGDHRKYTSNATWVECDNCKKVSS